MAARRVPAWNDQVPRLQAFRAAHPDVEIMTPVDTRSPWWKAFKDGEQLATEHDLKRLLDTLDGKLDAEGLDQ